MKNTSASNKSATVVSHAPSAAHDLVTLDVLSHELGAPSDEVRRDLLDGVLSSSLVMMGRRADSVVLYRSVPAFVLAVRACWLGTKASARPDIVGYNEAFLAVLVALAVELRTLHGQFKSQGPQSAVELARRKEAASAAFARGRALRDQAARLLRRALRGRDIDLASLEESIGTAETPAELTAGLNAIATEVVRLRHEGGNDRVAFLDSIQIDDRYVARLREAAAAVERTHTEADASRRKTVTKDSLDEADGRLLHVADWIYRAFKEGNSVNPDVRVPDLGGFSPYLTTRRAPKKEETPAPEPSPAPIA